MGAEVGAGVEAAGVVKDPRAADVLELDGQEAAVARGGVFGRGEAEVGVVEGFGGGGGRDGGVLD